MKSKSLVYVILYLMIYIGFVQKYIFNNQFMSLLPDLLIFYLAFVSFRRRNFVLKRKFVSVVGKPLYIVYALLVISSVIGALLNFVNIVSFIWGLRVLIRYPLLVWIVYKNFENSDFCKYKQILYTGFGVNIFCCIFQFFRGDVGDLMAGTFTGNDSLMLYAFIVFIISSADRLCKMISMNKYMLIVFGAMLIAIWAEIKMIYFLFPLAFYAVYVFVKRFNFKLIVLLFLGFMFLIPTMKFFMSFYYGQKYVEQTFNTEFIVEETTHAYGFQEGGFNRSTAIEKADAVLLDTPQKKFFGNGLGSGSISSFFGTGYSVLFDYTMFWNFSTSYCLAEMGWVGFILYCLFFLFIIIRFFFIYRETKDPVIKYWASIGIVSGLFTFILAWYNDNVYYKYLPMYFLWGICLAAIECQKRNLFFSFKSKQK